MLLNIYYILGLLAALGLLVWILIDDFKRHRNDILRLEVWIIVVVTMTPFLNVVFWGFIAYNNWWNGWIERMRSKFR